MSLMVGLQRSENKKHTKTWRGGWAPENFRRIE